MRYANYLATGNYTTLNYYVLLKTFYIPPSPVYFCINIFLANTIGSELCKICFIFFSLFNEVHTVSVYYQKKNQIN